MTLVGLLNDFLLQKKIGGLSPKTIDSYKNALHVFVLYAGGFSVSQGALPKILSTRISWICMTAIFHGLRSLHMFVV